MKLESRSLALSSPAGRGRDGGGEDRVPGDLAFGIRPGGRGRGGDLRRMICQLPSGWRQAVP